MNEDYWTKKELNKCHWVKKDHSDNELRTDLACYELEGGTLSNEQRGYLSFFQGKSGSFFSREFGPMHAQNEEQAKKEAFQILESKTRNEHLALGYAARDLGY